MEKCQFCGAEKAKKVTNVYTCGTVFYVHVGPLRSDKCYGYQIAQLQARIEELEGQLEEVYLKDRGKTNEINILTKENNLQFDQITVLQRKLELWRALGREIESFDLSGLAFAQLKAAGEWPEEAQESRDQNQADGR